MTTNSMAAKLQKLIAKADSSTHPEEAATFMAKARKLMDEHGITMMQLGTMGEDPVGVTEGDCQYSKAYTWAPKVAYQLALYYGCEAYTRSVDGEKNRGEFVVSGRESARMTLSVMYPYVHREIMRLGREAYNNGEYKSRMTAASKVGNAMVIRLIRLVREHREANPEQRKEGLDAHNALVPVDIIEEALQAQARETGTKLTVGRKCTTRSDNNAMGRANSINLNSQMGGGSAKAIAG